MNFTKSTKGQRRFVKKLFILKHAWDAFVQDKSAPLSTRYLDFVFINLLFTLSRFLLETSKVAENWFSLFVRNFFISLTIFKDEISTEIWAEPT